jgi:hypothetical protein
MAASDPGSDPVYVIDELLLKSGQLEDFLSALEAHYRPGAEARGQRLVQTMVTPPTETEGVAQSVILIWVLDGVAGFWTMRSQNATEEVAAWWVECESFIQSRTRRLAAAPGAIAGFEALGRLNG